MTVGLLEDFPNKISVDLQSEDVTNDIVPLKPRKATVIDGMTIVHAMGKPPWVKTCAHLADHFIATLDSKCREYDELHLVFDRYDDLPTSLKKATRERRQGRKPATAYLVTDNTLIGKVSASGVARVGVGGSTPPHSHRSRFFHSRKVTAIKYYNVSLMTRRTINSHNLRKTNHLGRVVRLLAW